MSDKQILISIEIESDEEEAQKYFKVKSGLITQRKELSDKQILISIEMESIIKQIDDMDLEPKSFDNRVKIYDLIQDYATKTLEYKQVTNKLIEINNKIYH